MDGGRLVIVKLTHWMDDETLAVKLAASIGMVTAGALMIASAGHIETLIGPLFFLAGYALAVGGRAYFILLHPTRTPLGCQLTSARWRQNEPGLPSLED